MGVGAERQGPGNDLRADVMFASPKAAIDDAATHRLCLDAVPERSRHILEDVPD
jgi:hypothetical protein